jgi:small-conductance mechanosensitive channel
MKNVGRIGFILLLAIVMIMATVSCSSGISQDEYDRVLNELADAQDEIHDLEDQLAAAKSVETEGVESSLKYQDLLKDYDTLSERMESLEEAYSALNTEHEELKTTYEIIQAQNESQMNQINLLQTQNTQLQAQLDELTPPFPTIATTDIEQALFARINEERIVAGLEALRPGKNLTIWAKSNSEAMSIAKETVNYLDNWVPYQKHFIAAGYHTLYDMIDAIMVIWQSNLLSYQNNILADDAVYGSVSVTKTGDVFYITFFASNFS